MTNSNITTEQVQSEFGIAYRYTKIHPARACHTGWVTRETVAAAPVWRCGGCGLVWQGKLPRGARMIPTREWR